MRRSNKSSIKCFTDRDELRYATVAYLSDSASANLVQQTYGQKIGDWCVSNITDFSSLFNSESYEDVNDILGENNNLDQENSFFNNPYGAYFNEDLSNWDTSSGTKMSGMFWGAYNFNGDVSNWDVKAVTDMSYMFWHAKLFNGDVSKWDVSSVMDMSYLFAETDVFNSDISKWDVSSVTKMRVMFLHSKSFNMDISNWNITSVTDMSEMWQKDWRNSKSTKNQTFPFPHGGIFNSAISFCFS